MFDRENIGVRISRITHNKMDQDEMEVPLTVLTGEINPLTQELAGELHDKVKRTLYTAQGAEVDALIGSVTFTPEFVVSIAVRSAPDQKKAVFTIDEAQITKIRATRTKKSLAWTLQFDITVPPQSDRQLAQLVDCYLKVRYLTFAEAKADLFSESREAERKARRNAASGDDAGESATAH